MAVFTQVPEHALKNFLMSYDIGDLVSYEGIKEGVSNTNYFLVTTQGRFVLTLFEPRRVLEEDVPYYIDYALTIKNVGAPRTMIQKDGTSMGHLCNRPAVIYSLLEGEGAHKSVITPDRCEKAGAALAGMHIAAEAFPKKIPNHFGLRKWQEWVRVIGADMNRIDPGLYDLAKSEVDYISNRWPALLPAGAIHGDYFPDNVFFKNDLVSGVIDFHFVCTDLLAYDLAIACNAWCFDENNYFREDRMQSLMNGYNAVRPLSAEEKAAMPMLLRAAALRFLLSRIEEKLNWKPDDFMKPHDPMVFEKRLRHFQK